MKLYGVDIGKNGGACSVDLEDSETTIELLDFYELSVLIKSADSPIIIMEKLFVCPGMNPQLSITLGMNKQKALDFIHNKLHFDVHPRSWQKYLYTSIEDETKFKTIKTVYKKTLDYLGAKVYGSENDGKRASVLIAIYGLYYLITDGIKQRKLEREQYLLIEKYLDKLVPLKKVLYKKLIDRIKEDKK